MQSSVLSVQSVGDLKALREREKQFKFLFKFVWIINQLMTLNLDMFLYALRWCWPPGCWKTLSEKKQFKFLFKFS